MNRRRITIAAWAVAAVIIGWRFEQGFVAIDELNALSAKVQTNMEQNQAQLIALNAEITLMARRTEDLAVRVNKVHDDVEKLKRVYDTRLAMRGPRS